MTRAKDRAKKANLPSLEERYRYRRARRSTPAGIVAEALAGDREMIMDVAEAGAALMHEAWGSRGGDSLGEFAFYLANIMSEIAEGKSPNEAFGWSGHACKWKLHGGESWQHVEAAYFVGGCAEALVQDFIGKSRDEAIRFAADIWRVDVTECGKRLTSVAPGLKRLNKTQARVLALEFVAAYGVYRFRVAYDTADAHHKEFIKSRGSE